MLGAAAYATDRIHLMTYVTCPSFRYHPAVVAQKAVTVQLLSKGRFTLGLGAGENLNEHVIGEGWPRVAVRHERLREAVQPDAELCRQFDDAGGQGKPRVGQVALSYDPDRDVAIQRAHEQFRWFSSGWAVKSELPGPGGFQAASEPLRPEDVAGRIACGPDTDEHVEKIRAFLDAGFTHVALVQIGGAHQGPFLRWAEGTLLPALRRL